MSLIFRLAGNRLGQGHRLLLQDSSRLLNYVRPVTIKCTPVVAPLNESHDERNAKFNRPLSPFLSIYKQWTQLTAMLSISHRFTGLILTAYTVSLSAAAVYLECPLEFYIEKLKSAEIGAGPIYGLKFLLAFPLTYHFWNGIRHLLWDTGRFLTIREVYVTGWTMLAVAIVTAAILSGMS